jgi:hypothetical protein
MDVIWEYSGVSLAIIVGVVGFALLLGKLIHDSGSHESMETEWMRIQRKAASDGVRKRMGDRL